VKLGASRYEEERVQDTYGYVYPGIKYEVEESGEEEMAMAAYRSLVPLPPQHSSTYPRTLPPMRPMMHDVPRPPARPRALRDAPDCAAAPPAYAMSSLWSPRCGSHRSSIWWTVCVGRARAGVRGRCSFMGGG
jgi:hypothetical protein